MNKNWLLLLCALAMAGCVETKDEYTLNPDGTGKVKHEAVFQPMNLNLSGVEANKSPEGELKEAVQKELASAQGVEAWRDVTYERDATGKMRFTGTAYFREYAKVKFYNNGFKSALLHPTWKEGVLELVSDQKERAKNKPIPKTDVEVERALAEAKAKYQQTKPMLASVMGSMKAEMSFRLPGTVTQSSNFERAADGTLRIQYSGAHLLAVMEKFMTDDATLREQIKAGQDPMQDGPGSNLVLNQQLFGEAQPVRAVVKVDAKPLFDFAGEVAAAKAQMPAVLKALGIAEMTPVAPAGSAELKSVKVGGVRWVKFEDREREIRPFNWTAGYTLSVIAELPGSVLKAAGGELTKAVADNGDDLLPTKEWDRKIHFPNLSKDKAVAIFEVKLASPSEAVRGFKEIAGTITYVVGEKTKKVELGFAELAAGATGKELGAALASIKPSQWDKGSTEVELRLRMSREMVKAVEILDAKGQSLGATINGYSGSDKQVTLTLRLKSAVPKDGRMVVETYEDLKKFEAPFSLKNINLLGQPLK